MCKFSRKASFSSYLQQYNRKQLKQLILCPFGARKLAGGKGHETALYYYIFRLKMLVGIRRLVMNVLPEGNLVFRTTDIDPGAETVNWSSSMHLVVLTLRSRKNFVVEGSVVISTSFYLHVLFHVDVQFAEDTLFHFSFSLSLSLSLSLCLFKLNIIFPEVGVDGLCHFPPKCDGLLHS